MNANDELLPADVRAVDAATLAPIVQAALRRPAARLGSWRGDPREARLGHAASAARWSVGPLSTAIHAVTSEDPGTRINLEGWLRMPLEAVAEQLAGLGRYLLDLADEAVGLIEARAR